MRKINWLLVLPLLVFLSFAGLFAARLLYSHTLSRPALIEGKPAPNVTFPGFEGGQAITPESFKGKVTVLNVFASWCPPCLQEHPFLMQLSQDTRFEMVGINYKDNAANAKRFLSTHGNPYARLGIDERGRNAIEWGVYGIPETFIIGRDGLVKYKFIGPLTQEALSTRFMPRLEAAIRLKSM